MLRGPDRASESHIIARVAHLLLLPRTTANFVTSGLEASARARLNEHRAAHKEELSSEREF